MGYVARPALRTESELGATTHARELEQQGTVRGPLWLLMAQMPGVGSCGWLVRMAFAMNAFAHAAA